MHKHDFLMDSWLNFRLKLWVQMLAIQTQHYLGKTLPPPVCLREYLSIDLFGRSPTPIQYNYICVVVN